MNDKVPVLVIVAHPDDWQLFAGSAVYAHLRDPRRRVSIVTLTAGDAGDDAHHWKSRHSGALLSVLRALPSWSPYSLGAFESAGVPGAFHVTYERRTVHGKVVLQTTITDDAGSECRMFSLHLPDGGAPGGGYAPARASLANLHAGRCELSTLWPEDAPSTYRDWNDLIETLGAIIRSSTEGFAGEMLVYAPDPDAASNPGDHPDHVITGLAVRHITAGMTRMAPAWMSMYDIGNREENLSEHAAHDQRAAIHAYGGGYMANAAGTRATWRRGWEREYECFKNREYVRTDPEAERD